LTGGTIEQTAVDGDAADLLLAIDGRIGTTHAAILGVGHDRVHDLGSRTAGHLLLPIDADRVAVEKQVVAEGLRRPAGRHDDGSIRDMRPNELLEDLEAE